MDEDGLVAFDLTTWTIELITDIYPDEFFPDPLLSCAVTEFPQEKGSLTSSTLAPVKTFLRPLLAQWILLWL